MMGGQAHAGQQARVGKETKVQRRDQQGRDKWAELPPPGALGDGGASVLGVFLKGL